MKKMLALIAAVSLTASTSILSVSCSNNKNEIVEKNYKEYLPVVNNWKLFVYRTHLTWINNDFKDKNFVNKYILAKRIYSNKFIFNLYSPQSNLQDTYSYLDKTNVTDIYVYQGNSSISYSEVESKEPFLNENTGEVIFDNFN